MSSREYRTYTFLKLNSIDGTVRKLDTRLWALLVGIVITVTTVIGSAVL